MEEEEEQEHKMNGNRQSVLLLNTCTSDTVDV